MDRTPAEETASAVRAELARRKITGRKLAEDMGWSHSHTNRQLNGKYSFRIDQLAAIADYLGCPLSELIPAPRAAA